MKKILLLLFILLFSASGVVQGQRLTESIHLNQIGFYPDSPKQAVVTEGEPDVFYILTPDFMDTLYTGRLSPIMEAPNAGERVRIADFSDFSEPGTYILWLTKLGYSYQFTIAPRVYEEAAMASLKSFYHQRLSIPISYEYGGIWARPEGHPDTVVYVHPSAATENRPAGTVISAPKGWYDAGDYNKYAVNSGITMGTMFSLYEDFPGYVRSFDVDIPETGNGIPDLLDELLWNLRWFLDMQDPYDGGVYHKLTNPNFDARVMPAEARNKRYVIQKSVTGTLNFAAVMAQAARIFDDYEELLPGLADSCLAAAKHAWEWAQDNPDMLYNQHAMNQQYDPDILTGAYGDRNATDEFFWAGVELYVTTGDKSYLNAVEVYPEGLETATIPTWNSVQTLGYYTLSRFRDQLPRNVSREVEHANNMIIGLADSLVAVQQQTGYRTVMDGVGLYNWGSSSNAANQGIALINAYLITGDTSYIDAAQSNVDYLLGRNATGFSFLTGYGSKQVMYPHHRPSDARPNIPPVPGLLSGGPNSGQQDECVYPSDLPAKSFLDDWCSYASNEVAINWNSPLVYLLAAFEALQERVGYSE